MIEIGGIRRESVVEVRIADQGYEIEDSDVEKGLPEEDFVKLLGEVVSRR